jgi:hypothetical protein
MSNFFRSGDGCGGGDDSGDSCGDAGVETLGFHTRLIGLSAGGMSATLHPLQPNVFAGEV